MNSQRTAFQKIFDSFWIPLFLSAVVIAARAPSLFYSPRFWAEEGSYYYRHAVFSSGFFDNLFYVRFGYYNLIANIAGWFAAQFPMEWAPLGTTLVALVYQLIPAIIIMDSRAPLLSSPLRKFIALLIPIFTLKSTEVWLNSINSQYFAALAVFLLLLDEDFGGPKWRMWFRRSVIITCGLSGPASAMLAPMFLLRYWQTKNKSYFADFFCLFNCGLFHVSLLLLNSDGYSKSRFQAFDLSTLSAIYWAKTVLLSFIGFTSAEKISLAIRDFIVAGGAPWLSLALTVPLAAFFYYLIRKTPKEYRLLLPLAYFSLSILTIIGSIGEKTDMISPMSGQRYFWAPNTIFNFWLLALVPWERIRQLPKGIANRVPVVLIVWVLFLGITSYWRHFYIPPEWPVWSQEVQRYRQDPNYRPKIWPDPWDITMAPENPAAPHPN